MVVVVVGRPDQLKLSKKQQQKITKKELNLKSQHINKEKYTKKKKKYDKGGKWRSSPVLNSIQLFQSQRCRLRGGTNEIMKRDIMIIV